MKTMRDGPWYGNPDGTVIKVDEDLARQWAAGYLRRKDVKVYRAVVRRGIEALGEGRL